MAGQESTRAALNRYFTKQAREVSHQKRTNKKPEFEFRKLALKWLSAHGWDINVVESKGVYNFSAGRYDQGQADAGFTDLVGVTPYHGVAAYIELKAPGRRATLKPHQHTFLTGKINSGAFGACIDDLELLSATYEEWRRLISSLRVKEARGFLLNSLPKVKALTDRLDDIL